MIHNMQKIAGRLDAGSLLVRTRRDEGQTLVEYALILSLVAILVAAVLVALQGNLSGIFNQVSSSL